MEFVHCLLSILLNCVSIITLVQIISFASGMKNDFSLNQDSPLRVGSSASRSPMDSMLNDIIRTEITKAGKNVW